MATVSITWKDRSNNEAGFTIERCQGQTCTNFQTIATVPANTTRYTDTNLLASTYYRYRVSAFNKKGRSAYTNILTVLTAPDTPPVTPPAPVLNSVVAGDAKNTLNWSSSSGGTFKVKRATSSAGAYITVASGLTALTYIDQPLTNGTTYYYVVSVVLNGVESANSNQLSGQPTAPVPPPVPAAPQNVTATPGDGQILLQWAAVPNALTYNVKRALSSGGPFNIIISGLTVLNYTNTGLTNNTTYYYVITATNANGTSANSAVASATPVSTTPPPNPDPPPPGSGKIINVPSGFDLQAGINSANPGDIVVPQAGATFIGNFSVVKDNITIQTSNLNGLGNGRLAPNTSQNAMPKLRGIGGGAALVAGAGLTGLSVIGLDVTIDSTTYTPDIVDFQSGISNVTMDRCFVHPKEITAANLSTSLNYRTSGRGVHANGINITVKNSYIAGFAGYELNHGTTAIDSEGVYSDVGPGPIYITNNYLEANFNCFLIGGSNMLTNNTATLTGATTTSATFSTVAGLSIGMLVAVFFTNGFTTLGGKTNCHWGTVKVSNIVGNVVTYAGFGQSGNLPGPPDSGSTSAARWDGAVIQFFVDGNTLAKRPEWLTQGFGAQWKAFGEVKSAYNSGITNNTCIGSGYHGNAFGITPRNQNGADPWNTVYNLYIGNNNLYTTIGAPLICQQEDNEATSTPGSGVIFDNNLVPVTTNDIYNYLLALSGGGLVKIIHNTFVNNGVSNVAVGSIAMSNPAVQFDNNIVDIGTYGWSCAIGAFGTCWPGWTENKNLVVTDGGAPDIYPNSIKVANYTAVKFVNQAGGDFRLAADSPGKGAASDGTDIGADMTKIPNAIFNPPVPPPSAVLTCVPNAPSLPGMLTRHAFGGSVPPQIVHVTNLNDSGSGSLRTALGQTYPRVIVGDVSGTLTLASDIIITNSNYWIAGGTWPAPGLQIKGFGIQHYTHDWLMEHITIRPGDGPPLQPSVAGHDGSIAYDGSGYGVYNGIYNHCTLMWAQGKNVMIVSISQNGGVSFYRSISAEGLYRAQNVIVGDGEPSGFGLLLSNNYNGFPADMGVFQSLLAFNSDRNPELEGPVRVQFINNVISTWGYDGFVSGSSPYPWAYFNYNSGDVLGNVPNYSNIIGNTYIAGLAPVAYPLIAIGFWNVHAQTQAYLSDNAIDQTNQAITLVDIHGSNDPRQSSPVLSLTDISPYILDNASAKTLVLAHAGARPAARDSQTSRIITQVTNRTGSIISSQNTVGGWPAYAVNTVPFVPVANPLVVASNGYTNLENQIFALNAALE